MKLLLFCWICVTSLYTFTDAMYNGEFRSVKDYPYMVQVYYEHDGADGYCGASILSEHWIVSAAHCFRYRKGTEEFQVRVESSQTLMNGKLLEVEKVLVHGDCDPNFGWDNDIALIKLKDPIEFNEYQQPIHIGKATPKLGENITFLGFGDHHHGVYGQSLRSAETPIIKDEACFESYEHKYTKNMFCTGTQYMDLCFGDSGGPAVHDNKLIGVISQGCEYTDKHRKPIITVKVANHYDWILRETGIKYSINMRVNPNEMNKVKIWF